MQKVIESFEKEVSGIVSGTLYDRFKQEIRSELNEFKALKKKVADILIKESNPDTIAKKVHEVLIYDRFLEEGQAASQFLEKAEEEIQQLIDTLPELTSVHQKEERFKSQKENFFWIKTGKFWKRIGFGVTDLPRRVSNLFRKKTKPKVYWSHQVPLREIARQHLLVEFLHGIKDLRSTYQISLAQAYEQLMTASVNQNMDLEAGSNLTNVLSKNRTRLKKELIHRLNKELTTFRDCVDKVGTIELSRSYYHSKKVDTRMASNNEQWSTLDKGWKNTFYLLFDEWRSDLEVFRLMQESSDALTIYEAYQSEIFNDSICPHLDQISAYLSDTESALRGADDQLSSVLKKSNYRAQKDLDEGVIPALLETLSSKNTINAIGRLENTLSQSRKAMATDFKMAKTAISYEQPTPDTEIATLSFSELITFEVVPDLQAAINQVKGNQLSELDKQITFAGDLDHMITFALSAAIEQLQEHDDTEAALKIALESLNRTNQRVMEIKASLEALFTNNGSLELALERYQKELSDLMVNDNVRDMRIRIAKAKAIQQTKAYRTEFLELFREVLLISKDQAVKVTTRFTSFLSRFRQRFILTSKKQLPSREVSDFLTSAQEKINSLPVIYKNLYKIEPARDMELFVGRDAEVAHLEKAYASWVSGKAGSAIIFGEKWSGLTSLLNFMQSGASFKHPMVRIKCEPGIDTKENFEQLIAKLLPDTYETSESIADALNESAQKIVILEDIQNLFLRKPSGFNEIKSLMELISRTSQRVFWVASCTLYTWTYLKKTIRIQDVFSYPIALKTPSEEELSTIIRKRNRVSGYKIIFEGDDHISDTKAFKKLTSDEQQDHLKTRFFRNLIDYSEGNISMTLMYWLLSTKSVDQNVIKISSFRNPDLSFIQILNMEKILALHALILHDGLTLDQFAKVIRYGYQASFLILSMMQEDGILIKKDQEYLINPLVYRSVISLLKQKNLIYA